jgi:hypothetical protein
MNEIIEIAHKSKSVTEDFQFTADADTWSFTAETDGELYEVSSSNVDSYTLNGSSIDLPFAITEGTSYTVVVTKITEGETASIQLKYRRASDKQNSYAISDLFKYVGRYAYCLEEFNGVVHKVDTALLGSDNYEGDGVWTENPVINSITLPTLPDEYYWSSIGFVKSNDREKIICIAGKDSVWNYEACFIYVDNDEVYDLLEENKDSYSSYYSDGRSYYSYPRYFLYDYINEKVFFKTLSGSTGNNQCEYNLLTHETEANGYSQPFSQLNTSYNITRLNFDPVRECFCENRTDVTDEHRTINFKIQSVACGALYDIETGYSVSYRYFTSGIQAYDQYGDAVLSIQPTYSVTTRQNGSGSVMLRKDGDRYYCAISMGYDKTNFLYVKLYDKSYAHQATVTDLIDAQTDFYEGSICASNYSSLCLLLGIDSTRTLGKKRIHILEPGLDAGNTITQRYLDFTNDLTIMVTNQLLV